MFSICSILFIFFFFILSLLSPGRKLLVIFSILAFCEILFYQKLTDNIHLLCVKLQVGDNQLSLSDEKLRCNVVSPIFVTNTYFCMSFYRIYCNTSYTKDLPSRFSLLILLSYLNQLVQTRRRRRRGCASMCLFLQSCQ